MEGDISMCACIWVVYGVGTDIKYILIISYWFYIFSRCTERFQSIYRDGGGAGRGGVDTKGMKMIFSILYTSLAKTGMNKKIPNLEYNI